MNAVAIGGQLLLGVAAGLVSKWADESSLTWLSDLSTGLSFWIFVTAGIGWLARSPWTAALTAAVFFTGLNMVYYASTRWVARSIVPR